MAFIPRPTAAPSQQQPAPKTFRVADSPSSKAPWLGMLLLLFPAFYFGNDFYCSLRHTGIYRTEFTGEVVSARPTMKSMMEFAFSGSRRRRFTSSRSISSYYDGQNIGRYVISVRDENGKTFSISVSKNTYLSTLIPSYVVGHDGGVRGFPDRLSAVKAGAVVRQVGDPL